ncbi:unnamed protein product [marine sediment metagenome]|uniref:Uncharacterized protein n=1 Tax=marine sediment metagenome TaxID=412755 RepID=X0S1Z5_9ZZZZ
MGLQEDMGARLTAQGVASTGSTGWQLVYRDFHPEPDQQVVITESGGFPQENPRVGLDYPTFQVRIRGSSDAGSSLEAKAEAVDTALNFYNATVGGVKYLDVLRQGDRLYLGRDESHRPTYSLNYVAWRSST